MKSSTHLFVKKGYGVLAGPPSGFRVTHIHPTFAILRWAVPKTLGKTVTSYNVHYRMTNPPSGDSNYKMINTKTVPFILEELMSSSEYEVYVTAVNSHGVGEPTARILFRTLSIQLESTDSNVSFINLQFHQLKFYRLFKLHLDRYQLMGMVTI